MLTTFLGQPLSSNIFSNLVVANFFLWCTFMHALILAHLDCIPSITVFLNLFSHVTHFQNTQRPVAQLRYIP